VRIAALRALLTKAIYPDDPLLGDLAAGLGDLFNAKLLGRSGVQTLRECRVTSKGMHYIDQVLAVPVDEEKP
jgi:hypothetical protein